MGAFDGKISRLGRAWFRDQPVRSFTQIEWHPQLRLLSHLWGSTRPTQNADILLAVVGSMGVRRHRGSTLAHPCSRTAPPAPHRNHYRTNHAAHTRPLLDQLQ